MEKCSGISFDTGCWSQDKGQMKGSFYRALLLLTALLISAYGGDEKKEDKENRVWTDSKTERTLEGKIVDKHRDGTRIEIRKKEGGHVWLKIDRLIEKDQKYARMWVKPQNAISISNKKLMKGGLRIIKVRAQAGLKPMTVKVITKYTPTLVKKDLKAGQLLDFTVTVGKGYSVSGYHGKTLVDQETALKKTGLTEQ